jgi:hypothetical protein
MIVGGIFAYGKRAAMFARLERIRKGQWGTFAPKDEGAHCALPQGRCN